MQPDQSWRQPAPGAEPLEAWAWLEEEEEVLEATPAAVAALRESDSIAEKIVRLLRELRDMLDGDEELRRGLEGLVAGRLGAEKPVPGVAVDSTFPLDGGLDLVGGHLVVVVAGYVGFAGACGGARCSEAHARALLLESEDARKQVPLVAKTLERVLVRRVLRKLPGIRIVLVDGELIPYPLLFKSEKAVERSRLLSRLDAVTAEMLAEARELGVTLVGVVKRSYSHLLSARLGRRLPLNDKAVMTLLLRPGSYAAAGRFSELLPAYAELVAAQKARQAPPGTGDRESLARQLAEKYREAVVERLSRRPCYGEVEVAFYRPSRPAAASAVRVEVLDYGGLGLPRVLAMLNAMTNPATGLPYPVDLVDEYTRIEARVLELLRRRVVKRLADLLGAYGPGALLVLGHTNPEKRYLYEKPLRRGLG